MKRSALGSKWWVALWIGLAVPLAVAGCDKKKLTEIEVPDSGVDLAYDVTSGQAYGGHIRMRNAVQTPVGDIIQSIEFDVDLVVAGPLGDSNLVKATVSGLKLDIRLPEGIPAGAGGAIPPEVVDALNGTELRFHLSSSGAVAEMPEPPENAPQEVQAVVGMVVGALQAGFVTLPDKSLKNGDTWNPVSDDDDEGRTGTGTFNGMARDDASGEDVARLAYAYQRAPGAEPAEGASGPRVEGKQDIEVLFSVAGYPVQVLRKSSGDIKGIGGFNSEVKAEWKKLDKRVVEPPTTEVVQEISDPCDPDYVGPEDCGPAEPAEGDEAVSEEPPADEGAP
jgi:hypothetical protein